MTREQKTAQVLRTMFAPLGVRVNGKREHGKVVRALCLVASVDELVCATGFQVRAQVLIFPLEASGSGTRGKQD
jgi:hypothetical protein